MGIDWRSRLSAMRFQFTTRDMFWAVLLVSLLLANNVSRVPSVQRTGRELNVAIRGKGYFQLDHTNTREIAYSRNSKLAINNNSQLCIGERWQWAIFPPLVIPPDARSIEIHEDGQVMVIVPGANTPMSVGQIQLATFVNHEGLEEIGDGIFRETIHSGPAMISSPGQIDLGLLQQFYSHCDGTRFTLQAYPWELMIFAATITFLFWEVRTLKQCLVEKGGASKR